MAERRVMVDRQHPALAVTRQCQLSAVSRSSVYRRPVEVSDEDRMIMALMDRPYLARPFYGSRRMAAWLATQGHPVNRKRAQRLMQLMGLVAIYQRPNLPSKAAAASQRSILTCSGGLSIDRVNQVWCSDVTYIPMAIRLPVSGGDHGLAQPGPCWPGGSPTRCTLTSVSRRWRRPWLGSGGRRSSTPTRVSQFTGDDFTGVLEAAQGSPSAWTAGAAAWTTSSLSGCGAASSMKRSTCTPTPASPRPKPGSAAG